MIIHKTMRMPSSCTMCWISNTCDVWTSETCKQNGYDKRLDNCPLEEVKTGTPTVDAVPVVRCKDCYWFGVDVLKKDGTIDKRYKPTWCYLLRESMNETDYCSLAKSLKDMMEEEGD